jgi:hypothetical protein
MYNLKKCNDCLKKGFPTEPRVLLQFPFGNRMLVVIQKLKHDPPVDRKDPDAQFEHRRHVRAIVDSMNRLLTGSPREIIQDHETADATVLKWLAACRDILGNLENPRIREDDHAMWRLEAFLHDVGKSLTAAKHPTRGQYLITQLDPEERDKTIEMLGDGDWEKGRSRFDQIEKVVGFHDRFGVLSTGEASLGILADTVERGLEKEEVLAARKSISHIMIINLIDMDATIPGGLTGKRMDVVLDDWRQACWDDSSPLMRSGGDRVEFERLLLDRAQKDVMTYTRIERLIHASYMWARSLAETEENERFRGKKWPEEEKANFRDTWPELPPDLFRPKVKAALKALEIHWDDFCIDFAHVVKIDYLLYFTRQVVLFAWKNRKGTEVDRAADRLAGIFMRIVEKLIDQFVRLIRQPGNRLRIGIDLSVLRDTPAVQKQIAALLNGDASQVDLGLRWLVHEASAWPFI